jgi:hypothetical protein
MVANGIGFPVLSLTVPVTVRVCAIAVMQTSSSTESSVTSFFIVVRFS